MEIKGFNGNDISGQSRDALQSQDWKGIREAMKAKVKHFTMSPLVDYGEEWGGIVREYLLTGYNGPDNGKEVEFNGGKYKILKRTGMTVFYDAGGDTLFEVGNERLAAEYECLMKECGEAREGQEEAEGRGDEKEEKSSGGGGAVLKLQAELKNAENKLFAEPIIGYLIERCRESESLAADICQGHKTWAKCFDYIFAMARKQAKGNCAVIRNDTVFEWAEDYYHKDDTDEEEKKVKKAAEGRPKRQKGTVVKKPTGKGNPVKDAAGQDPAKEKKIEKPKEQAKAKKKDSDMEGQINMFSLLGMQGGDTDE